MKLSRRQTLLLAIIFGSCSEIELMYGKRSQELQEYYKKIGDELISVRKQFTESQPKIYTILDQLDKMHGIAKHIVQRKKEWKRKFKQKERENTLLKKDIEKLKQEFVAMQQTCSVSQVALNQMTQKLDLEKQQSLLLQDEKTKLVDRIKQIAENGRRDIEEKRILAQAKTPEEELQSFTRNSTSEPISSR